VTPLAAATLDDVGAGPSLLPLRFQPTSFMTHAADMVLEVDPAETVESIKTRLKKKYEHFFDAQGWSTCGFVLKNPVNASVVPAASPLSVFLHDGVGMAKVTTAEPEKIRTKVGGGWAIHAVDPTHGAPLPMATYHAR